MRTNSKDIIDSIYELMKKDEKGIDLMDDLSIEVSGKSIMTSYQCKFYVTDAHVMNMIDGEQIFEDLLCNAYLNMTYPLAEYRKNKKKVVAEIIRDIVSERADALDRAIDKWQSEHDGFGNARSDPDEDYERQRDFEMDQRN